MNIILDVAVVLIFAAAVFIGYYNGFVKSVLRFFGGIACFVVSLIYAPMLGDYFNENFVLGFMKEKVTDKLASILQSAEGINLGKLFEDKPKDFLEIFRQYNVNVDDIEAKFKSFAGNAEKETVDFVSENIVANFSKIISYVGAFILILIAATIALKLLIWLCDIIFKLPVLSTADTVLGMVTGAILGLLFVYVFCMLIQYLMPYMQGSDNPFIAAVDPDKTLLYKMFAFNNLLSGAFSSMTV